VFETPQPRIRIGAVTYLNAQPLVFRLARLAPEAQVIVDLITQKLSPKNKKIIDAITRGIGIILFLFIAYNFFMYGLDVKQTGERTASFKIRYYPFCFAIALSFLFQSLTIFCDLIKTVHGGNHE